MKGFCDKQVWVGAWGSPLCSQDTVQICSQLPCKIKNIIKIFLQAASVLNTHNLAPALILLPTDVSVSALDRNHFREEGQ